MAAPLKKAPPPPPIAVNDPIFNRWLHDLTAFITDGGIDTGVIPGYDALVSTVATHTTEIATNTADISTNTSNISTNTSNISTLSSTSATHTSQIATNTADISTNTSSISTLAARSQVFNGGGEPAASLGVNGDWYADVGSKIIYIKVSGTWIPLITPP